MSHKHGLVFVFILLSAISVRAATVSSPTIVATYDEMSQTSELMGADASLSSFKVPDGNGGYYTKWISTNVTLASGDMRIRHTLYQGDQDFPYGSLEWEKVTCPSPNGECSYYPVSWAAFNASNEGNVKNDNLWFTSIYQENPSQPGLLAFVHEEHIGGTGSPSDPGQSAIGLAWSSDYGNSWAYLGRIIRPDANFDNSSFNVQGTPFFVDANNEYIYIFFNDRNGVTSARANLAQVLAHAQLGWVGPGLWHKYDNGAFTGAGMGGPSTSIGIDGVNHTQAAYSTHSGKYYLTLTFANFDGNSDTYVKLYESTNGYNNWTLTANIALEPASSQRTGGGYQYCSLSDSTGRTNGIVGQKFFVYCLKNPGVTNWADDGWALYRWEVNLSPVEFYSQSANFSSSPTPYWKYLYGPYGSWMSWQGDHWQGSDYWSRIYPDGMHPGDAASGNLGVPLLTWVAPHSGVIHIDGTVRKSSLSCGDGIYASAAHNGTTIFYSSLIDLNNNVGQSIDRTQATRWVSAGDELYFMVSSGPGNNYCDSIYWDPSITYQ